MNSAAPLLVAAVGFAGLLWWIEASAGRRPAEGLAVIVVCAAAVILAAGASVAGPLAAAAIFFGAAWGVGASVAGQLGLDGGAWRNVPLRLAMGWAVLAVTGTVAGAAGVLSRGVVGATLLVGVGLAAVELGRAWPFRPRDHAARRTHAPSVVGWCGLAVLLLGALIGALAPEVGHDALAAHLPVAREFAARGAIVAMPSNTASYLQLNADVLYTMAMLALPGAELPKLLHFGAGATAALLVYDLGVRLHTPGAGLVAAAVVAGTPLVWWLAATAYTDLWVTLFVVGALWAADAYRRRPGAGRASAAGLLAGAALGTKMTAAAFVVPLVAVLLLWVLRSDAGRDRLRALAGLAAGLVVGGGYWYARAYALLGNPLHPLFPELFGLPWRAVLPTAFGMGRGPLDLLALPWRVTVHPARFVEVGSIGVVYLLLLPAALAGLVRGTVPRWLATVFVGAGLTWALTAQYLRYFVPALPLAALMGAVGAWSLPGRWRTVTIAGCITAVAAVSGSWVVRSGWELAYRVAVQHLARGDYAALRVPGYRVARFSARALPADARILSAGENLVYYYDRDVLPASWRSLRYDPEIGQRLLGFGSGERVKGELRRHGFSHLVVAPATRNVARRFRDSWIAREAFWEEGPRLLYADGNRYLFEVNNPLGPVVSGPSLLPQAGADAGRAVEVAVSAGTLYALEAHVRADGGAGRVVLRVEWVDAADRPLVASPRREVAVGEGWRRVAMAATAPDRAVTAVVAVEWVGRSRGIMRSVRFYELR
ncbi:MAG: hypothetical protein RB149_04675 [Armatimonadota bacterium]|nr:hypothetical protein [Armatimonadota bacterium]MDR7453003.1 hypothetical protein [Armatimonadota bacterium]